VKEKEEMIKMNTPPPPPHHGIENISSLNFLNLVMSALFSNIDIM
jgi:hypothetical protein